MVYLNRWSLKNFISFWSKGGGSKHIDWSAVPRWRDIYREVAKSWVGELILGSSRNRPGEGGNQRKQALVCRWRKRQTQDEVVCASISSSNFWKVLNGKDTVDVIELNMLASEHPSVEFPGWKWNWGFSKKH